DWQASCLTFKKLKRSVTDAPQYYPQRNDPMPSPQSPRGTGSNKTPPKDDENRNKRSFWSQFGWGWLWILAALLGVNWLASLFIPADGVRERIRVPYTTFIEQVQEGNVTQVTTQGDLVRGRFRLPVTYPTANAPAEALAPGADRDPRTALNFETRIPAFSEEQLSLLRAQGIAVFAEPEDTGRSWWLTILFSFGPAILIFGLIFWMSARAQKAQGGIFSIGKSKAKRFDVNGKHTRVTFADVAGIDESKQELQEIVGFLKEPRKYQRLGGRVPRGVLLVGPPGTGKTLLAKAVAGEAGVPFFSMSASEFVEMVVGVGAARVRDLFTNAKKEAPAIIFIDELDAIGRKRSSGASFGTNQEQEQTLNQILAEMDGFGEREAVIILAATNRPDVLDPALMRPGRFDRRVVVQRPDRVGREAILRIHTRGIPLDPDVDLAKLAALTPGLVGAELENLVNEAALLAARQDQNTVTAQDFTAAMEKIVLGTERRLVMTEQDRKRVAYHEAGHTLMALLMPGADPIRKVSIVPRGQALGVTYQMPLDDRHNYSEDYLTGRIGITLGGRVAEELAFTKVSTGAEHDLKQATQIARQMVARWGMSEKVGLIYAAQSDDGFLGSDAAMPEMPRDISNELVALVDSETKRILQESYDEVRQTLHHERHRLDALAEALLEDESLDEEDIRRVTGLHESTPQPPVMRLPEYLPPESAAA
ncbi:MAG TPA: ATP-dependent zinc metalloprotease FtsH, partial [Chloroflexota bacterium]|nr:ATP-dependent zinc metalloprotease FtsH [Chloroflexota bacterium]